MIRGFGRSLDGGFHVWRIGLLIRRSTLKSEIPVDQEKERIMKKQKEPGIKHWTIEELIRKSGRIMNNPVMAAIAAHAPSPTAADEYVKILGWPNEVASQVRHAVRLRQKFPESWENFKMATVRSCESLSFAKDGLPDIFGPDSALSQGTIAGKCVSPQKHWPVIFRELRYKSKARKSPTVTTFDLDGTGGWND